MSRDAVEIETVYLGQQRSTWKLCPMNSISRVEKKAKLFGTKIHLCVRVVCMYSERVHII